MSGINEVYVVMSSQGQYEDRYDTALEAYPTREAVEERVKELNKENDAMSERIEKLLGDIYSVEVSRLQEVLELISQANNAYAEEKTGITVEQAEDVDCDDDTSVKFYMAHDELDDDNEKFLDWVKRHGWKEEDIDDAMFFKEHEHEIHEGIPYYYIKGPIPFLLN